MDIVLRNVLTCLAVSLVVGIIGASTVLLIHWALSLRDPKVRAFIRKNGVRESMRFSLFVPEVEKAKYWSGSLPEAPGLRDRG